MPKLPKSSSHERDIELILASAKRKRDILDKRTEKEDTQRAFLQKINRKAHNEFNDKAVGKATGKKGGGMRPEVFVARLMARRTNA